MRAGAHTCVQLGWRFERGPAGQVTVSAPDGSAVTLEPHAWASVVATVSADGDVGFTPWAKAASLHMDRGN